MRKALAVFLLLIPLAAFGQYISYWFQGWQRQGDAADAQAYFMRPGTNIVFTYASNRVYINASGTITNLSIATNALYAQYATNWLGSNSMWLAMTNYVGSNFCTGLTTNFDVVLWMGGTTNIATLYFTNGLLKNMIGAAPIPPVATQHLTDDAGTWITDDIGAAILVDL